MIANKYDQGVTNALQGHLDNMKYNNFVNDTEIDKIISYFMSNWAKSVTNTPSVLLKQMTSFLPYMEDINPIDYMKNYGLGALQPLKTKEFMKSISPYINVRFNSNKYKALIDEISSGKENPIISWFQKMNNKITFTEHTLTEVGDIISVIYGGYARYQTNIDNGMTKEQALKDFEEFTVKTQQSNLKSLQAPRQQKNNLFYRLSGMFMSQDSQYFQKNLQNWIKLFNGDIEKAKFIQHVLLYNLLMPAFMTLVNGAIASLYGKKDKDFWYYLRQYMVMVGLSFTGLGLIRQSVTVNLFSNRKYYWNKSKQFQEYLFNVLGSLTGKPIQNYWRMFFERKNKKNKKKY
jgi:hypothetical protein